MSITTENLNSFGIGLVEVLIFIAFLAGFWKLLNVGTRSFDDHAEIVERQNWGYLIRRLGIATAQGTAMLSSVGLSTPGRWGDLTWLVAAGVWVVILLIVSIPLIDRIVGRHVNDARLDNLAVSMVKAGFYVAFGFVVNGSLSGTAPDWLTAVTATVVFTVLGGVLLVACYVLTDLITRVDMRQGIRDGKLTSSLEAAGLLVALGLIMRNAIAGNFAGWTPAFVGFAVTAVAGLVVMYGTRWLIDRLVLTHATIREVHESNQLPAAALLAATLPLAALPVTAVVGALVA